MDDYTAEQALRQQAIRRRLQGERPCEICRDLQRSRSWFDKWWAVYRQQPSTDFSDHSRAPHRSPQQLPPQLVQAIVTLRHALEAAATPETRYGLIGQRAIWAELQRLGLRPLPSLSTIQRVLAQHGLTHPRPTTQPTAYYPEPLAAAPNAIHATDIITRHLRAGAVVQNFHTFDHYSHAVHLSQHADKSAATAQAHLLATWADLGLPLMQQFDNEDCFSGGHTHACLIGQVVRLCLFVGVEVLFIPFYEAKRNHWVEGFHALWLRGFWSRHEFHDLAQVQAEAPRFGRWYHTRYQPPSLHGQTPAQMRASFRPRRLTACLRRLIPQRLPITAGRMHFIRRVDGRGEIRFLNVAWRIGPKWAGEYVWAMVDTAEQRLSIWHKAKATAAWRLIKTRRFRLEEEVQDLLPAFRPNRPRCREHWPG